MKMRFIKKRMDTCDLLIVSGDVNVWRLHLSISVVTFRAKFRQPSEF